MTVSRETLRELFGEHLPAMEEYASILSGMGVERGLIGPREVDRLWERHLVNCGVVAPRVPEGATVADVGAGAGLPGLVWAIMRPDITVTLIEPLLRRTTFLDQVVETLSLKNAIVLRARAEDVEDRYEVVTARAVAALAKLGKWCMPLVRPEGVLLAMKGQSAPEEVAKSRTTLKRLGASKIVVATYGERFDLEVPTTVVEVSK